MGKLLPIRHVGFDGRCGAGTVRRPLVPDVLDLSERKADFNAKFGQNRSSGTGQLKRDTRLRSRIGLFRLKDSCPERHASKNAQPNAMSFPIPTAIADPSRSRCWR